MDPIQRNCSLIFDECDLKGVWSYNQRLKQNFPPCKKLLVVMVRGLVGKAFKEIVYFKGDQMMTEALLMELVEKIEETGFKTRIISCDMGNQQVLKIYYKFEMSSFPLIFPMIMFLCLSLFLGLLQDLF